MNYSISEQLSYLNGVLERLWCAARWLVHDRAVHGVWKALPDLVRRPLDDSDVNLNKIPGIYQNSGDIRLRIPRDGNHSLSFFLNLDITTSAEFNIELVLNPSTPPNKTPWVNTEVVIPWYAHAALAGTGFIFEEIIEEFVNGMLSGENSSLGKQLRSLDAITFNYSAPFLPNNPSFELITQPDLGESLSSTALDWIDIVLVADNYAASQKVLFENNTEVIERIILKDIRNDNVRFRAMSSVIRFWRLFLSGTADGELIAKEVINSSGSALCSLANLSRLAEAGLSIRDQLTSSRAGRPPITKPILVVLQQTNSSPPPPRAVALGDIAIVPINVNKAEKAASVLIHELGHVVGGLADEYCDSTDYYMGPEPRAINISKVARANKWKRWLDKFPHASIDSGYKAVGMNMGAYEFVNIFRPSYTCKMRESGSDVAFCPVCEEVMAHRLLKRVGLNNPKANTPLTIEVEYLSPWKSDPKRITVAAPLFGGGSSALIELAAANIYNNSTSGTTLIRLSVVRTAIPDAEGNQTVQILPGSKQHTSQVYVDRSSLVKLEVTPDELSPLPLGVKAGIQQSLVLTFNNEPDLQLTAPTDLLQEPEVGAIVKYAADSKGNIKIVGGNITFKAISGDDENLRQNTETVFAFHHESDVDPIETSKPDSVGSVTTHQISIDDVSLPFGRYRWEAFTRLAYTDIESVRSTLPTSSGDYHFDIQLSVETYSELPSPFDLAVIEAPLPETDYLIDTSVAEAERSYVQIAAKPGFEQFLGGSSSFYMERPDIDRREWREPKKLLESDIFSEGDHQPPYSGESGSSDSRALYSLVALPSAMIRASAYHPEGKPLTLQFEVKTSDEDFTGADIVHVAVPPPRSPHSTFKIGIWKKLSDFGIHSVDGIGVKFRVRTLDEDGLLSPWAHSQPDAQPRLTLQRKPTIKGIKKWTPNMRQ